MVQCVVSCNWLILIAFILQRCRNASVLVHVCASWACLIAYVISAVKIARNSRKLRATRSTRLRQALSSSGNVAPLQTERVFLVQFPAEDEHSQHNVHPVCLFLLRTSNWLSHSVVILKICLRRDNSISVFTTSTHLLCPLYVSDHHCHFVISLNIQ